MALGRGNGRASLADVARAAGVSQSTASKILNDVPTVSARPETRRRVLDAANQLGYRPHVTARALAGVSARALALLVPELTNPSYSRLIRGAFAQAQEHGYTVLVAEDFAEQRADASYRDLVAAGHVDGILMASARQDHPLIDELSRDEIPHVFVNRPVPGSGRNVVLRMADASTVAVDHLAGLGHRHIGHVAGPWETTSGRLRAEAFRDAMTQAGLSPDAIVFGDFDEAGGDAATRHMLAEYPEVTALFCSALSQAVGAIHALSALGMRIPDDVSLIAYDDLPLANFLVPEVDTIAMPLAALGRTAVDELVEQLNGRPARDVVVPDPPSLVVRSSSAPPPAR